MTVHQRFVLRPAAIEDAGFVQVDMGFHEAGDDQATARIQDFGVCRQGILDGDDVAAGYTDVGGLLVRTPRHPAVFQDEIDDSSSPCGSRRRCT
jgi:hypothetical protein